MFKINFQKYFIKKHYVIQINKNAFIQINFNYLFKQHRNYNFMFKFLLIKYRCV